MDLGPTHGACCLLIACERGSSGSIGSKGSKGVGAAPDPSTQFSLLCLYIFEHPTFHSSFIGLQGRFLASLEMTIRESDVFKPLSHPVT